MPENQNPQDDITRIINNDELKYGTLIIRLREVAKDEQAASYVEQSTLEAFFDPIVRKSAIRKLQRIGRTSENDQLKGAKIVAVYPRESRLFILLETLEGERTNFKQVYISDIPPEYRDKNLSSFEFKEPTETQE